MFLCVCHLLQCGSIVGFPILSLVGLKVRNEAREDCNSCSQLRKC
ncbi:hypothetical protein GLYMA_12G228651v4 [Glycine max]|nr:hypothetical protein GLYMA_12G228651v4 [Glycine max]KAH1144501.1 hypothetical protein GYH30_034639 [Glycine max]